MQYNIYYMTYGVHHVYKMFAADGKLIPHGKSFILNLLSTYLLRPYLGVVCKKLAVLKYISSLHVPINSQSLEDTQVG